MSIHVALSHITHYTYDRTVTLGPQIVRLRPAPHSRTQILSYSLKVEPLDHFLNWQQDPFANYQARLVFPTPTREFKVTVDMVVDMVTLNPFDFFLEPDAEEFPFKYSEGMARELAPYLITEPATPLVKAYLEKIDLTPRRTNDFLVQVNQQLQKDIKYTIRMEPGVQTPEQTLELALGSCRDTGWLLVQLLRHMGLAARFVSGYLIQLKADVKSLDGPSGTEKDFTDLHAWAEVFLPGAGWVGLDPTSGLMAGEGHIPLACTPEPSSAAPIEGGVDESEVVFTHHMGVQRIVETPRVTLPYSDEQWAKTMNINLTGAFHCIRAASSLLMKAKQAGRIINITSVIGEMGNGGQAAYAASKAGLIGLTMATAREMSSRRVTVNAIAPGFIETDMTAAELPEAQRTKLLSEIPLGRIGAPAEIADCAAFLAGPEAAYITGQVLRVNGGMLM